MARKYLQMGFTCAKHYTNYKGGKKYVVDSGELLEKGTGDPQKAIAAAIFYKQWQIAESTLIYKKMKQAWKTKYS